MASDSRQEIKAKLYNHDGKEAIHTNLRVTTRQHTILKIIISLFIFTSLKI